MVTPHNALPKHRSRLLDDRSALDERGDRSLQNADEKPPRRGDVERAKEADQNDLEHRDEWVKNFIGRLSGLLGHIKGKS